MDRKKGFTLIELLVVIAIIALLLSIMIPALHLVKMKASSAVCLTNTQNLTLGWLMYQEDNDGRIMGAQLEGRDRSGNMVGWIGIPYRNVLGDLTWTQTSPAVTDEDEIRGIMRGLLFSYVGDPQAYHCPGDRLRISKYDGTKVYSSYCIPACLYGLTRPSDQEWSPYRETTQITKLSEITSPSSRYVFVEVAEERNWNACGWFLMGAPEYTNSKAWGWWVPLAVNHGDSSILGFVDGSAQVRRWRDPYTRERVYKLSMHDVPVYGIDYPPPGQNEDIEYMARGWPRRPRSTDWTN